MEEVVDDGAPESLIERMKVLAASKNCFEATDKWGSNHEDNFCDGCIVGTDNKRPDWWRCNDEVNSAKRWLAEHGIKESKPSSVGGYQPKATGSIKDVIPPTGGYGTKKE